MKLSVAGAQGVDFAFNVTIQDVLVALKVPVQCIINRLNKQDNSQKRKGKGSFGVIYRPDAIV